MSIGPIRGIELPAEHQPSIEMHGAGKMHVGSGRPRDRVFFMRNDLALGGRHRPGGFGGDGSRLHVVLAADQLIVTEAENLHEPGATITGRKMFDFPGGIVFRLSQDEPQRPHRHQCSPATGIAVLTLTLRRRRLSVTGALMGMQGSPARMIDATEEPSI
ncbi:MAG: hypothetical protein AB7O57_04310 [Hyphomicrobiaceae bacterium]